MKAKSIFSAKRILALLLALCCALLGLPRIPAWAQEAQEQEAGGEKEKQPQQAPPPSAPSRGMEERVSLDLRSTEVTDALKYLATKGNLNMSISKNVGGRVNLFLNDIPIRDVFDLILRSNELAYDRTGEVYNIMTDAEYRALYGRKFSDLRKVKTFRLQYAIPQQAFNLLDTLKSEIGRLLVDEDSGTVMILDTQERLEKMEEALATLEQGGMIRVFDLRYAKAKDVEERLKEQLELNKLGFIKADERSNQVIVKTFPDRMKDVERLITALDRKTREVLINAKIVKVTYTRNLNTGIDWNAIFSNIKFHGFSTGPNDGTGSFRTTTTGTAPSEVAPVRRIQLLAKGAAIGGESLKFPELLLGTISASGIELFRYLETLGDTKVISSPRLLVTENTEARIHVGTREAYITTTTTTGQTTSTTAEEVEFIDVGIQFAVTPTINDDGYVTLKVKPEVSSVVRTLTTPSNNKIPIVDTSTAETSVMVKDGSTVVIGGLRKTEKKRDNDELPILGKIPVLGNLFFKQRDEDDELTELVIFITPHIVSGEVLVTGDEDVFGGGIKDTRSYEPVLDQPGDELPPPDNTPLDADVPPPGPAPHSEPGSGMKLHIREDLRLQPGS